MAHQNIPKDQLQSNLPDLPNVAAKGISYFTPAQNPPAGTALDPQPNGKAVPKLFQPLKIRGLVAQNRIVVSEKQSVRLTHI